MYMDNRKRSMGQASKKKSAKENEDSDTEQGGTLCIFSFITHTLLRDML
jgi:hypothetical protein